MKLLLHFVSTAKCFLRSNSTCKKTWFPTSKGCKSKSNCAFACVCIKVQEDEVVYIGKIWDYTSFWHAEYVHGTFIVHIDDSGLWGWNPVLIEVSGKCAKDSNRTKIPTLFCIRRIFQYLLIFGDSIFEIVQRTLGGESQGSILLPWEPVAVPAASSYVLFLPSSANGKW